MAPAVPDGWRAFANGFGVLVSDSVGGDSYVVPDVLVVPDDVLTGEESVVRPHEALFVAQVISPSSARYDRPGEGGGLRGGPDTPVCLVETAPELRLTALRLVGEHYEQLVTWGPGATARIAEPFAVGISVDALGPGHAP